MKKTKKRACFLLQAKTKRNSLYRYPFSSSQFKHKLSFFNLVMGNKQLPNTDEYLAAMVGKNSKKVNDKEKKRKERGT